MIPFRVDIVTDKEALVALKDPWNHLTESIHDDTVFFATWKYTFAYVERFNLRHWGVIAIYSTLSGELEAVFPLKFFKISSPEGDVLAVKPMGITFLPYIEFPIRAQSRRAVLHLLFREVLQRSLKVDAVFFWPLHESSPLYRTLLEDMGGTDALKTMRFPQNLYQIETRGLSFEHYCAGASTRSFVDARYQLRKASRAGRIELVLSTKQSAESSLSQMFTWYTQKFGKKGVRHLL